MFSFGNGRVHQNFGEEGGYKTKNGIWNKYKLDPIQIEGNVNSSSLKYWTDLLAARASTVQYMYVVQTLDDKTGRERLMLGGNFYKTLTIIN